MAGFAGPFRERRAIGDALALTRHRECVAEIVLRHGPLERHAVAGPFREGRAIGV